MSGNLVFFQYGGLCWRPGMKLPILMAEHFEENLCIEEGNESASAVSDLDSMFEMSGEATPKETPSPGQNLFQFDDKVGIEQPVQANLVENGAVEKSVVFEKCKTENSDCAENDLLDYMSESNSAIDIDSWFQIDYSKGDKSSVRILENSNSAQDNFGEKMQDDLQSESKSKYNVEDSSLTCSVEKNKSNSTTMHATQILESDVNEFKSQHSIEFLQISTDGESSTLASKLLEPQQDEVISSRKDIVDGITDSIYTLNHRDITQSTNIDVSEDLDEAEENPEKDLDKKHEQDEVNVCLNKDPNECIIESNDENFYKHVDTVVSDHLMDNRLDHTGSSESFENMDRNKAIQQFDLEDSGAEMQQNAVDEPQSSLSVSLRQLKLDGSKPKEVLQQQIVPPKEAAKTIQATRKNSVKIKRKKSTGSLNSLDSSNELRQAHPKTSQSEEFSVVHVDLIPQGLFSRPSSAASASVSVSALDMVPQDVGQNSLSRQDISISGFSSFNVEEAFRETPHHQKSAIFFDDPVPSSSQQTLNQEENLFATQPRKESIKPIESKPKFSQEKIQNLFETGPRAVLDLCPIEESAQSTEQSIESIQAPFHSISKPKQISRDKNGAHNLKQLAELLGSDSLGLLTGALTDSSINSHISHSHSHPQSTFRSTVNHVHSGHMPPLVNLNRQFVPYNYVERLQKTRNPANKYSASSATKAPFHRFSVPYGDESRVSAQAQVSMNKDQALFLSNTKFLDENSRTHRPKTAQDLSFGVVDVPTEFDPNLEKIIDRGRTLSLKQGTTYDWLVCQGDSDHMNISAAQAQMHSNLTRSTSPLSRSSPSPTRQSKTKETSVSSTSILPRIQPRSLESNAKCLGRPHTSIGSVQSEKRRGSINSLDPTFALKRHTPKVSPQRHTNPSCSASLVNSTSEPLFMRGRSAMADSNTGAATLNFRALFGDSTTLQSTIKERTETEQTNQIQPNTKMDANTNTNDANFDKKSVKSDRRSILLDKDDKRGIRNRRVHSVQDPAWQSVSQYMKKTHLTYHL